MHKSHETLLDCGFKKVAGKNDGKTPITSWLIFLCAPVMRLDESKCKLCDVTSHRENCLSIIHSDFQHLKVRSISLTLLCSLSRVKKFVI